MSVMTENKLKHLEFIQNVVNRLSTNSFLLKGWTVVLVGSLFVLSDQKDGAGFVYLAFLPALVFWGLDGYFLWQERVYRELYNRVRAKEADAIDFDMDTRDVTNDVSGWVHAIFSKTLVPFHGVMVTAIAVVWYLQRGG